jgi:hypothetical protein
VNRSPDRCEEARERGRIASDGGPEQPDRGRRGPLVSARPATNPPLQSAARPPSSRGLGRRPLTAETGVRIPVAVLRKPALRAGFGRLRPSLGKRLAEKRRRRRPAMRGGAERIAATSGAPGGWWSFSSAAQYAALGRSQSAGDQPREQEVQGGDSRATLTRRGLIVQSADRPPGDTKRRRSRKRAWRDARGSCPDNGIKWERGRPSHVNREPLGAREQWGSWYEDLSQAAIREPETSATR